MSNLVNGQDKNKVTYTKDMLIKNISLKCNKTINTVREVYNTLEENIEELLSSANDETDVLIRLFEGISINSTFVPEKEKKNNLTGKIITTASKIKPRVHITRNYCEKLTSNKK